MYSLQDNVINYCSNSRFLASLLKKNSSHYLCDLIKIIIFALTSAKKCCYLHKYALKNVLLCFWKERLLMNC